LGPCTKKEKINKNNKIQKNQSIEIIIIIIYQKNIAVKKGRESA
jgi:hypothetical protein